MNQGVRRLLSLVAVSAVGASLFAASAHADAPAVRLVRRLGSAHRPHPLVDATGRVPLLTKLPPGADAASFGLIPVAPGVGAIRLPPEQVDAFATAYPELSLRTGPPRRLLLDQSRFWTRAEAYRTASGKSGQGVVVGIIDTGLDVSHLDFRGVDGKTRVAWMLVSGAPTGKHQGELVDAGCDPAKEQCATQDPEDLFGCTDPNGASCSIYDAAEIDEMIASGSVGTVADRHGHGTHVASIAAGNGGIRVPEVGEPGGPCGDAGRCVKGTCTEFPGGQSACAVGCTSDKKCPEATHCITYKGDKTCAPNVPRFVGMAPGATLIIAAPSPSGGGFYDDDVLKAAHFIFDRAERLGMPAVVNISIGGDFGSHDGTSVLEQGLAAFVGDDKPGRSIVVAAGNSGGLYKIGDVGPLGVHTEAHVSPSAVTRVPVYTPEVKSGTVFVWATFRPGDEVSVGFEGPDGEWIGLTDPGDDAGYEADGVKANIVNNQVKDGSPIDPGTNSAVIEWDGGWAKDSTFAVLLSGKGDAQLWVTGQGDAGQGEGIGVQFVRSIRQGTINVPASHPSLLAVGCTINRTTWTPLGFAQLELQAIGPEEHPAPDSACYFSSAGPTPFGVPKPEISAPGGFVAGAMSVEADPRVHDGGLFAGAGCPPEEPFCYVVDDSHAITTGTSMSAPHVTGAVALLLERAPELTQARIVDILQAGARRPDGNVPYDYQLGPGVLDVEGAVAAMAKEGESFGEPDVTKSWYSLSSAYARPDASWPVWGTVELRRADSTIASGLDGTKLSLAVNGGIVIQSPTKVRHGMWRFAVAGPSGSGGSEMTIEVAYDGVSLGTRKLPIGTDVWAAKGGVDGVGGGCTCSAAGARSPAQGVVFAFLAASGVAALRRRRGACSSTRIVARFRRSTRR